MPHELDLDELVKELGPNWTVSSDRQPDGTVEYRVEHPAVPEVVVRLSPSKPHLEPVTAFLSGDDRLRVDVINTRRLHPGAQFGKLRRVRELRDTFDWSPAEVHAVAWQLFEWGVLSSDDATWLSESVGMPRTETA